VSSAELQETRRRMRSRSGTILSKGNMIGDSSVQDVLLLRLRLPGVGGATDLYPAVSLFVYANHPYETEPKLVATCSVNIGYLLDKGELGSVSAKQVDNRYNLTLVDESVLERLRSLGLKVSSRIKTSNRGQRFSRALKKPALSNIAEVGDRREELHLELPLPKTVASFMYVRNSLRSFRRFVNTLKAATERIWYRFIFAVFARLFLNVPDVADRLGLPEPALLVSFPTGFSEDLENTFVGDASSNPTYLIRQQRGFVNSELETCASLSSGIFQEHLLYRGDSRVFGSDTSNLTENVVNAIVQEHIGLGQPDLVRNELRRALLEGKRPRAGVVKLGVDLVSDIEPDNLDELRRFRLRSLREFGRAVSSRIVLCRVYVLCARALQHGGAGCNPYLKVEFFGGAPSGFSTRDYPVQNSSSPEFFLMFESHVACPGGSVRIEVKNKILPRISVPFSYPWYTRENSEGHHRFSINQGEVEMNFGEVGVGWSEELGSTQIDIDSRWYSPTWHALEKAPVEVRHLWPKQSPNSKGVLEVFVDLIDEEEYGRRPWLYPPMPLDLPAKRRFMIRCVIFTVTDCTLPWIVSQDVNHLANLYVLAHLGNESSDERRTDVCRNSTDGSAEFNWRMGWWILLPDSAVKPRLKLQVYEDLGFGTRNDRVCAVGDIHIAGLFNEALESNDSVIKRKQPVSLRHPVYPEIDTRVQVALEIVPERVVDAKRCRFGYDGYLVNQDEDYILPKPFRPALFSLVNPSPFFQYTFKKLVIKIKWELVSVSLLFPFLPLFFQFVAWTPWQWYLIAGGFGLLVFLRVFLLEQRRQQAIFVQQRERSVKNEPASDASSKHP